MRTHPARTPSQTGRGPWTCRPRRCRPKCPSRPWASTLRVRAVRASGAAAAAAARGEDALRRPAPILLARRARLSSCSSSPRTGDGMARKDWLCIVAVHSDAWLLATAFYKAARFDREQRWAGFSPLGAQPGAHSAQQRHNHQASYVRLQAGAVQPGEQAADVLRGGVRQGQGAGHAGHEAAAPGGSRGAAASAGSAATGETCSGDGHYYVGWGRRLNAPDRGHPPARPHERRRTGSRTRRWGQARGGRTARATRAPCAGGPTRKRSFGSPATTATRGTAGGAPR